MKVISITSSRGTVYVIEVAPDVYFGERWFEEGKTKGRAYPSWFTRERAEARLNEIKKEKQNENAH